MAVGILADPDLDPGVIRASPQIEFSMKKNICVAFGM